MGKLIGGGPGKGGGEIGGGTLGGGESTSSFNAGALNSKVANSLKTQKVFSAGSRPQTAPKSTEPGALPSWFTGGRKID